MNELKERQNLNFIASKRPRPSVVFDTYWKFAVERQKIFFNRLKNCPSPWTQDPILSKYKFTNVYRATDRVSQYLIKNVIYNDEYDIEDLFFRIILFKIFNKIETWEILENELGEISIKSYDFRNYDRILSRRLNNKRSIYSAAYIMASGGSFYHRKRKHQNHLKLIEDMITDFVPVQLQNTNSMKEGYNILLKYPTIGSFLAYQFITDINYSRITNYSEMEFVKAGPGAIEGINKCFSNKGSYTYEDIIKDVTEKQDYHFERLGLDFQNLFGRKLQLIDCQNIFCEVGKYARVAHPDIMGNSKRIRIKQRYRETKKDSIQFFFPPKWKLNY